MYTENICRKAKYELHALQLIRKYLSADKPKTLCNALIRLQFCYAQLIWMFAGILLISKGQTIHFRSLQVLDDTNGLNYHELLSINDDF